MNPHLSMDGSAMARGARARAEGPNGFARVVWAPWRFALKAFFRLASDGKPWDRKRPKAIVSVGRFSRLRKTRRRSARNRASLETAPCDFVSCRGRGLRAGSLDQAFGRVRSSPGYGPLPWDGQFVKSQAFRSSSHGSYKNSSSGTPAEELSFTKFTRCRPDFEGGSTSTSDNAYL